MTELGEKNRIIYNELVNRYWHMDEKSTKFIEERTKDTFKLAPEYEEILAKFPHEDQRIRFDIDMSNPSLQSLFADSDKAYQIFTQNFRHVISALKKEGCVIGYSEFVNNIAVYNKNKTKIKKIFKIMYMKDKNLFYSDFDSTNNSDKYVDDAIVKAFEHIGIYKKGAAKLQLVISFNPCDWLLSSTSESFSSCFNLGNPEGGYQYALGLPFLCGDTNRFMLYITDGTQKEFQGLKVDSARSRSWVILDKLGKMNIVKWYPNKIMSVEEVRTITGLQNFIYFQETNSFQGGKYELTPIVSSLGIIISVYNDMGEWHMEGTHLYHISNDGACGQQRFTEEGKRLEQSSMTSSYTMSRLPDDIRAKYNLNRWKKLGVSLETFYPTFYCSECGKKTTGYFVNDNDGSSGGGDKRFLCHTCFSSKVFVCDRCGEVSYLSKSKQPSQHIVKIRGSKGAITEKHYCDSCYSQVSGKICDVCGCYDENINKTEDGTVKICNVCLSSEKSAYRKCNSCGSITNNFVRAFNTYDNSLSYVCANKKDCLNSASLKEQGIDNFLFGKSYQVIFKKDLGKNNTAIGVE